MTIGTGIALAGWFLGFVWACSFSTNAAAGVVIFGAIIAAARVLSTSTDLVEDFKDEVIARRRERRGDPGSRP